VKKLCYLDGPPFYDGKLLSTSFSSITVNCGVCLSLIEEGKKLDDNLSETGKLI